MPDLNIKDPQIHEVAAELARRTDQTRVVARVMELARQAASQPVLDSRTPEQILNYDEYGIPR